MTQGYPSQPPRPGNAGADQDTTTLPKVAQSSSQSGGWTPSTTVQSGGGQPPAGEDGGYGSRMSGPAPSTVGAAKNAMRNAASEAESRSGRARSGRRAPRRARLTLSHINVYSVFKFSCVLAIALFLVWLIMVGVLYGVLDFAGVFSKVNETVHTIAGDGKTNDVVTGSLVFGGATIIGAVNMVLFIALSTIGAMIYNLCADLVGGAEVTLSERD